MYKVEEQNIYLRDIVAICCLVKDKELRAQKRLYLNNMEEFQQYFDEERCRKYKKYWLNYIKIKE